MTPFQVRQARTRQRNLAQRTAGAAARKKRKTGMGSMLRSNITQLAQGSPERQAQAERVMRAQAGKQQQLTGQTGRADVRVARQARLGENVRQQRAQIGEESRRAGIGQMMAFRQQQSALRSARSYRRYERALTRHKRAETSQTRGQTRAGRQAAIWKQWQRRQEVLKARR